MVWNLIPGHMDFFSSVQDISSNNESLLAPESGQDSDQDESLEVRYSEELDGFDVVIKDIYGLLVLTNWPTGQEKDQQL